MKDVHIVTIGILVPLVTLLIIGYISYEYTIESDVKEKWVEHTILVLQKLEHLFSILKDGESAQRGYILTGNESYLTPFTSALSEYKPDLAELRQMTHDNPTEQINLDKLEPLVKKRLDYASYIIELRRTQGTEDAVKKIGNGTGQVAMENIRQVITSMENEENSLLSVRNQESQASSILLENILVFGTATVLIVTTTVMAFIILHLRKRQFMMKKELDKKVEEKTILLQQANKVTESQKQELVHANELLKEEEKFKDEFVAMIAHDLKTPMIPIRGYLELLLLEKYGTLNKEQKERLEIIQKSTEDILCMIQDLFDAHKLELGKFKFDKKTNNLSELISEVVAQLKDTIEKHGVTVTTDLSNVDCYCDKTAIQRVLKNLIINSLDFISGNDGKITIKLSHENNHGHIIIKDNGIGIDKDKLDKIFVKFYQVDSTVTREHGGSGLGLSICKTIIENHEGRIWAESNGRGTGAEFHILL